MKLSWEALVWTGLGNVGMLKAELPLTTEFLQRGDPSGFSWLNLVSESVGDPGVNEARMLVDERRISGANTLMLGGRGRGRVSKEIISLSPEGFFL